MEGLTTSEKFVNDLCSRSFLCLWTHPNPKGKKGKELCDCLIVCGHHIIIISVKECQYKDTGDRTGWERWQKKAIDKSVAQIRGAEKWLSESDEFTRHDGRVVSLPPGEERSYHRVTVSLGGRGEVLLKWGDFGSGFVYLFDEVSVGILFSVLSTVTDFTLFLSTVESLHGRNCLPLFNGGGLEDLLALYLSRGGDLESLGDSPDMLILENDLWTGFEKSEAFETLRDEYERSLPWDRMIASYAQDLLTDGMFDMHSKKITQNELVLVAMALQPRYLRCALAEAFVELLTNPELKVGARVGVGFDRTAFVFMLGPTSNREARVNELALRCFVIRGRLEGVTKVVGIATDRPKSSTVGYSSDLLYVDIPEWTQEQDEKVQEIQDEFGYFKHLQSKH